MRIGVVGSINIDQVVISPRIPLKGETLLGESVDYKHGGKGANQAVACARLGVEVVMFAKVGDDENGRKAISNLKENGVDVSNIVVEKNVNTGLAIITVGEKDNTIVVISGANSKVDKTYIDEKLSEIKKCDVVILQNEIPYDTDKYVINICAENKIKIVLNPAPAMFVSDDIVDMVDYLTPNEHEVKLIFENMELNDILKKYPEKVVVTLGSAGVTTCLKDKGIITVPCREKNKVIDTTGAGDTFNAAFTYAIMSNYDMEKALKFANMAAGLSTEKIGAQTGMPNLKEVLNEM